MPINGLFLNIGISDTIKSDPNEYTDEGIPLLVPLKYGSITHFADAVDQAYRDVIKIYHVTLYMIGRRLFTKEKTACRQTMA